mmetsp:Transcript_30482/g.64217  ORF Transcript_30482/g.64217 Transcript_30482/m.64217 type:complete len:226 (-) Transcript_30482:120-797(-)
MTVQVFLAVYRNVITGSIKIWDLFIFRGIPPSTHVTSLPYRSKSLMSTRIKREHFLVVDDPMDEKGSVITSPLNASIAPTPDEELSFFVVVGFLDWMRFCDILNMFMILAGFTGMISGISHSHSAIWDCVSVHLYFLEAINLLHRDHDYEGYPCFRLSDICFLCGSLLDIANCYLGTVFGFSGIGLIYSDLVASFLWLGCAFIDLLAEFYFLRRHKEAGYCIACY